MQSNYEEWAQSWFASEWRGGGARGGLHSLHHNAPAGKSNFISVPQQNTLVICNQALQFPLGRPQPEVSAGSGARSTRNCWGTPGKAASQPQGKPSPAKPSPGTAGAFFQLFSSCCAHTAVPAAISNSSELAPSPPPQHSYTTTYNTFINFFFFLLSKKKNLIFSLLITMINWVSE